MVIYGIYDGDESIINPLWLIPADTKPPPDLESIFFDLETEMENNMCRDQICMSEEFELGRHK